MTAGPVFADNPALRRALVTVCAMTATIMQALDITIANVALPYMQGSLSASLDQINWVLTSYIVAAAIMTAPVGWLSDRFGRKNLFVLCVGGFTVASFFCALAQNIEQIVLFRLMQGMFGAALVPLSQSLMLDAYPIEQRAQAMSIWGMGVMIGPIMGPTVGGWLTETYSWHWVFLINLPIGMITILGLVLFMDRTEPRASLRFDWFGFFALAVGIGSLQLMLDRGEHLGWFSSTEIVLEAIVACVGFYFFLTHTLTTNDPFVRIAIFTDRNFLAACFFNVVIGCLLFSTMALVTPFMQYMLGYPVLLAGLLLASRGVGTLLSMFAVGRLMKAVEPRYLVLVGLILTAVTLYEMRGFNASTSQQTIMLVSLVQGLGVGLVFMPMNTAAFTTLPSHLRTDGSAILTLLRQVSSSIGISLVISNLTRTTIAMHARLNEHVTPFNDALRDADVARTLDLTTDAGRVLTERLLTEQAGYIAYANNFTLLMWLTIVSIPFVFLLGSVRRHFRGEALTPAKA